MILPIAAPHVENSNVVTETVPDFQPFVDENYVVTINGDSPDTSSTSLLFTYRSFTTPVKHAAVRIKANDSFPGNSNVMQSLPMSSTEFRQRHQVRAEV